MNYNESTTINTNNNQNENNPNSLNSNAFNIDGKKIYSINNIKLAIFSNIDFIYSIRRFFNSDLFNNKLNDSFNK